MDTKKILGALTAAFVAVVLGACSSHSGDELETDPDEGGNTGIIEDKDTTSVDTTDYVRPYKRLPALFSVSHQWVIDADSTAAIKAELSAYRHIPEGAGYVLENKKVYVIGADGATVLQVGQSGYESRSERMTIKDDVYQLFPVDEPRIMQYGIMTFSFDNETQPYDYFAAIKPPILPVSWACVYLYENLTKHYQDRYPDAGVRHVLFRQKLEPTSVYRQELP